MISVLIIVFTAFVFFEAGVFYENGRYSKVAWRREESLRATLRETRAEADHWRYRYDADRTEKEIAEEFEPETAEEHE